MPRSPQVWYQIGPPHSNTIPHHPCSHHSRIRLPHVVEVPVPPTQSHPQPLLILPEGLPRPQHSRLILFQRCVGNDGRIDGGERRSTRGLEPSHELFSGSHQRSMFGRHQSRGQKGHQSSEGGHRFVLCGLLDYNNLRDRSAIIK